MGYPHFINKPHERELWDEPWKVGLNSGLNSDFKAKCWEHGYLSPHWTRAEAASKSDSCGNPRVEVPNNKRDHAQYHAFALERVRHELGDRPMSALSWGRSPDHNSCVGGVSGSQHIEWWATDWSESTRQALGGQRFDDVMDRQFRHGGRGYQGNIGGPIRHVDNGPQREWTY